MLMRLVFLWVNVSDSALISDYVHADAPTQVTQLIQRMALICSHQKNIGRVSIQLNLLHCCNDDEPNSLCTTIQTVFLFKYFCFNQHVNQALHKQRVHVAVGVIGGWPMSCTCWKIPLLSVRQAGVLLLLQRTLQHCKQKQDLALKYWWDVQLSCCKSKIHFYRIQEGNGSSVFMPLYASLCLCMASVFTWLRVVI